MYVADPGCTTVAGVRSKGHVEVQELLDHDRRPDLVPDVYREEHPMKGGPQKIDTARFFERKYHDLEVERLWKRT